MAAGFLRVPSHGTGMRSKLGLLWGTGRALQGFPREKVVIASKWGVIIGRDHPPRQCGTREHLRKVVEASLKRMRVDYLDLLILRSPDPHVPLTDTVQYMKVRRTWVHPFVACAVSKALLAAARSFAVKPKLGSPLQAVARVLPPPSQFSIAFAVPLLVTLYKQTGAVDNAEL